MKKLLLHTLSVIAIIGFVPLPFAPIALAQAPRVSIPDFADLVEKASPAVVNIRTTEKVAVQQAGANGPGGADEQQEFFSALFRYSFSQYSRHAWVTQGTKSSA